MAGSNPVGRSPGPLHSQGSCRVRRWTTLDAVPHHSPPRSALVLGGSSDIARAVLQRLHRDGLRAAALAARDPEPALATCRREVPGLELHGLTWNATDVATHAAVVERAAGKLGGIDMVICAVGLLGHHAGRSMPPEEVDLMVRTNFAGPAAALAAAAEHLAASGRGDIVVLSSIAALRARRSNYVYGSSKAGLDVFAQGLGDALVGTGVRVLVVRPGFVRSSMTEGLDPAPLSTDPATVADAVCRALAHPGRETVHVPAVLGPAFTVLRATPRRIWRRVAGDR
jgi:decaprenylphospho-beta-D-erythro-pentofuranosid-2-ulose 2-reductase